MSELGLHLVDARVGQCGAVREEQRRHGAVAAVRLHDQVGSRRVVLDVVAGAARQRGFLVAYAIATLFGSLSTIPFVGLLGQRAGVQWLGLVMIIVSSALGIGNMLGDIRLGRSAAVGTIVRTVFATITIFGLVAFVVTALTGALPLYQVALILMLAMPAGTFVYVVSRIDR